MTVKGPSTISGIVIHGDQIGRTIGFPTANLDLKGQLVELEAGVYVGECEIGNQIFQCLPYYGPRLVLGEMTNSFEVYIFDFNQEIYGQEVKVRLLEYVREPLNFDSFDQLREQLEKDKHTGRKWFEKHGLL